MSKLFGNIRAYGTASTALMMEEKPSTEGAGECFVWSMDMELYNRTREVKKLEFLRSEQPLKVQRCKANGSHLTWVKEEAGC